MWPATAWDFDDHAGRYMPPERAAWSVMGRLRQRALDKDGHVRAGAPWESVLALVFATPWSDIYKELRADGELLNVRSGRGWDLFFPGYYRSAWPGERGTRLAPVTARRPPGPAGGGAFSEDWHFDNVAFDIMRSEIERLSSGRFVYRGEPTLVLVRVVFGGDEPFVDWPSLLAGPLTDRRAGTSTLGLQQVVYRISDDLERSREDPKWGVGAVVGHGEPEANSARSSVGRDLAVGVAASLIAAFFGGGGRN